jgi:GNAT superfamily N-acetyltransferase
MGRAEVRALPVAQDGTAAELLAAAWPARVPDLAAAGAFVSGARRRQAEGLLGAFAGGALVGVAALHPVGDVAEVVALAAFPAGRGTGAALLEAACELAEEWGAHAVRLRAPAGDPAALALCSARSFAVVDVAVRVTRPEASPPRLDAARGLEIGALKASDAGAIAEMDRRLTGLDRSAHLAGGAVLVARRRGTVCGFMAHEKGRLGPALAMDVADLGVLMARGLAEQGGGAGTVATLSTAAPTALLAASALGFRIDAVELVLTRGPAPPARPPQLY